MYVLMVLCVGLKLNSEIGRRGDERMRLSYGGQRKEAPLCCGRALWWAGCLIKATTHRDAGLGSGEWASGGHTRALSWRRSRGD